VSCRLFNLVLEDCLVVCSRLALQDCLVIFERLTLRAPSFPGLKIQSSWSSKFALRTFQDEIGNFLDRLVLLTATELNRLQGPNHAIVRLLLTFPPKLATREFEEVLCLLTGTSTAATCCWTLSWTLWCPTSGWRSWFRTTPDRPRRRSSSEPWATWHQSEPFFVTFRIFSLSLNGMPSCLSLTVPRWCRTTPDRPGRPVNVGCTCQHE
jgi:hypothetical protein